MFALLALLKGKRIKPKQHHFNLYSKVVCIIFHALPSPRPKKSIPQQVTNSLDAKKTQRRILQQVAMQRSCKCYMQICKTKVNLLGMYL